MLNQKYIKEINIMKKNNIFAEILTKYDYKLNNGDIVAGTITSVEKLGFLVNIGTEKAGYLPREETIINIKNKTNNNIHIINTTRDFFLITENKKNKQHILSTKRLDYIRAWKRIKQIYFEDIILTLKIYQVNKGGIITYLEGIQGFIPNSHICFKTKNNYIKCTILTINENKNQLILSNKSATLKISKHKFKIGELVYGQIIAIKSYGLFLNIKGIKALLHISEINHVHNQEYKNLFRINTLIKVKIIHLNAKQGQVSVSIRKVNNITNHHPRY